MSEHVYVVTTTNFEGDVIVRAVFSTKEAADSEAERLKERMFGNDADVEPFALDIPSEA